MSVMLLTEHHLEFLSLKGGNRGSSESTLVKMSKCWKLRATAYMEPVSKGSFAQKSETIVEIVKIGIMMNSFCENILRFASGLGGNL